MLGCDCYIRLCGLFELANVRINPRLKKSKIGVKKLENKFIILYRVISNKMDDNFYTLKSLIIVCFSLSAEMIINVAF